MLSVDLFFCFDFVLMWTSVGFQFGNKPMCIFLSQKIPLTKVVVNDRKMKSKLQFVHRRFRHFVFPRVIVLSLNMICDNNFYKNDNKMLMKIKMYYI